MFVACFVYTILYFYSNCLELCYILYRIYLLLPILKQFTSTTYKYIVGKQKRNEKEIAQAFCRSRSQITL